jgi:HK97 family phage major capsid protein
MTDNLEVKNLITEATKVIKEYQNGFEVKDALDKEKEAKMLAEFSAKQEQIETIKKNNERLEKEMEVLKAIANKPSFNDKEEVEKKEMAIKQAFFKNYLANGDVAELKALSAGKMEDGGYTIPQSTLKIIEGRIFETSDVERYANVMTTENGFYEFIIDNDEASIVNNSEFTAPSNTGTPTLQKGRIETHIYSASPIATQTLLEDSAINIENWLIGKVADKIARQTNNDFVLGNGIDKASGFLNAFNLAAASKALTVADAYSGTKIETYKSGSATAFTTDNIIDLVGKLKKAYRKNIFVNRSTETALAKLKDGDNRYLFNYGEDGVGRIKGMEVVIFNDIPSIGNGNACLVVGDLSRAYTIVKKRGLRIIRDELTNKPYVSFYTTARIGGGVEVPEALKVMITEV